MLQTNLREIDMADIDADAYAEQLKEYGATVVTLNAAGIIASYQTQLDCQMQSPYLTGSSLFQCTHVIFHFYFFALQELQYILTLYIQLLS